nr:SPASM domain-containing protein [Nanoarchaeota archaeon]
MEKYNLNGLSTVNVELTSRCNKNCWCCGRRRIERDYPELTLKYGDMDFELVKKIAKQLPPNIMVQLHNNGEGTLYPKFGEAVKLFHRQITNIVTNGKLLVEKADEIIDNLDTITISILENDPEADEQYKTIKEFLRLKGDRKPQVVFRLNGDVDSSRYEKFGCTITRRILHAPLGSFNYKKRDPTIPEVGICLDFLNHMAINSHGKVSICVRFDPKGLGVIGDANKQSLEEIWNSEKRMKWLEYHKQGRRDKVPLCSYCHFWGVPTGYDYRSKTKKKVDEKQIFGKK